MKHDLSIELLGRVAISMDAQPIPALEPPRLRAFLARLVLVPGTPVERAALAFDFWPDSTDRQARTNLRKLLYQLQQRLPNADLFVQSDNHRVMWRPDAPCQVDVHDFVNGARRTSSPRELRKAISLYRGPLLPGYYDEWILDERERLRTLYLDTMDQLASFHEHNGQFTVAAGIVEQRLLMTPYDELAWERLIRLYGAAGNRASALEAFGRCAELLSEELGTEPSDAIVNIYEQILAGTASADKSIGKITASSFLSEVTDTQTPPLIGRLHEFSLLRRWCYDALNGNRPTLIRIAGEAGIGKTRLAEEIISWSLAQGLTVAACRAYAPDQEMAFTPVRDLLRSESLRPAIDALQPPWRREVTRLLRDAPPDEGETTKAMTLTTPDINSPTGGWRRQELFEALMQALIAMQRPLILIMDDLHWWDRASIMWLHYLFSHLRRVPLAVVATVRPEEDPVGGFPELMAALQARDRLRQMELGPLTVDESRVLIEELVDANTRIVSGGLTAQTASGEHAHMSAFSRQAYAETEGNPLFLVEWVQAQTAGLGDDTDADKFVDPVSGLPGRIHGIIMSRLLALSAPARQFADAAAIVGRAFPLELPQTMTELNDEAVVNAVEELCRRRVLREHDNGMYDFAHARIRDVVVARLSTARHRFLHKRAAAALITQYGDDNDTVAIRLAEHYKQTGNMAKAAVQYGLAARYALSVYANDEAVACFRHGIQALATDVLSGAEPSLASEVESLHASLWEGLGDVHLHMGRHDEAQQAFSRAAAFEPNTNPESKARLLRKKGNAARASQRYNDAEMWYDQAEEALSPLPPKSTDSLNAWTDIQLDRLNLLYGAGRIDEMQVISEHMEPIIHQSGNWEHRTRYHHALATMLHRRDRFVTSNETLAHGEAQLVAARAADDPRLEAEAQFSLGFLLLWGGDIIEAAPYLQKAREWAVATGDLLLEVRAVLYLAFLHRRQGLIDEVRLLSDRALHLARRAGFNEYIAAGLAHRAWVDWQHGRGERCRYNAQEALRLWDAGNLVYPFLWAAIWPLLALELQEERDTAAVKLAEQLMATEQQRLPQDISLQLGYAMDAWQRNRPKEAEAALREALRLAEERGQS